MNQSSELLQVVADSLPVLLAYVDMSLRYQYNNAVYEDWLGKPAVSWKGHAFQETFTAEDFANVQPYIDQLLTSRQQVQFRTTLRHKTRGRIPVVAQFIPDVRPEGELRGFVSLVREISPNREEEMESARELQQKNEEIEHFVYTISHDLKTPLVTIQSFLGFLQEDIDEQDLESARDAIERISKASAKMRELIDRILEFSRLSRQKLLFQDTDLQAVVAEVIEGLSDALAPGDSIFVDGELPTLVLDAATIKVLFEHLLANALMYGKSPGKPLSVSIGCSYRPEHLQHLIYVKDEGPGIAPKDHELIFRLFQRLDSQPSTGKGNGLAMVQKIARLHHGKAWVESEPGHGATFWLCLPSNISPTRPSPPM